MSNNRMYLLDESTGEYMFLGKGWGDGWHLWADSERIQDFLLCRDMESSYANDVPTKLKLITEREAKAPLVEMKWDEAAKEFRAEAEKARGA